MALTPNTWNFITIGTLATPPWTTSTYAADAFVVDSIIAAVPVLVFCSNDFGPGSTAILVHLGGVAYIPSDAITLSSTPAMNVSVMDDGETWYSVRDTPSSWMYYGSTSGLVRRMTVSGPLGMFIT